MRVELVLGGADDVKSAFRGISTEVDKLSKQLDGLIAKIKSVPAINVDSGGSVVGASTPKSAGTTIPPIVSPPKSVGHVQLPPISVGQASKAMGAKTLGGAATSAAAGLAKINVVAGMAVGGIIALGSASMKAAEAITNYADFRFRARGGDTESRKLGGIANAAGVDLSEAAGLAQERAGGARQLNEEIRRLRGIKDDEQAARFAQMRGLEGFRKVRNMSDEQFERAQNAPKVGSGVERAVDRATVDLAQSLEKLAVIMSTALTPVFVAFQTVIARLVDVMSFSIENSPLYVFLKWLAETMGSGNDPSKNFKDAADTMNEAANKMRDTAYGGGRRTQNAIPGSWKWQQDKRTIDEGIKNLGGLV